MSARAAVRRSVIVVWLLILLIGMTGKSWADPIALDNDIDIAWSDQPCFPNSAPAAQPLCQLVDGVWRLKPIEELIVVEGAPRLVPDANEAGDSLQIFVDFLAVSLDDFGGGLAPETPLILNVFDVKLNPIPLQLTYLIAPSAGLTIESTDVALTLDDFTGFNLLPDGDLIFSVTFNPRLGITDSSINRPDRAVTITVSGPGVTEVPEPGTLVLLLSGVTFAGLGARWRRSRQPAR